MRAAGANRPREFRLKEMVRVAARVEVVVFGMSGQAQVCGCGPGECAPAGTLREVVGQLAKVLASRFGPAVTVRLVDVDSREMAGFPEVEALIRAGGLRLPATALNGQLRFQGGISAPLISQAAGEMLAAES